MRPSATKLQYYKGIHSYTDKNYQKYDQKPGPQRALSIESELLLTLTKIRLNLCQDDLAFLFSIGSVRLGIQSTRVGTRVTKRKGRVTTRVAT